MSGKTENFLKMVSLIAELKPTYRQPGDGSDGTCDCIGLVIGAVRRMGLKWKGIHGSNWTVRMEVNGLRALNGAEEVREGDLLFKTRKPGHGRYALPKRYRSGGKYFNGDLTDYYHVGVVTGVSPVEITHMSTGGIAVVRNLSGWTHCGRLRMLEEVDGVGGGKTGLAEGSGNSGKASETDLVAAAGNIARVVAPSGKYVKMRREPDARCRLYEEVPVGAMVTLVGPGETWAKISYGRRKGWYMMAQYLEVVAEGDEEADRRYAADMAPKRNLREVIRAKAAAEMGLTERDQKTLADIRELAHEVPQAMAKMLRDEELPAVAKIRLMELILDRSFGKAEATVNVNGGAGNFEASEMRIEALVRKISLEGNPYGEDDVDS